MFTIQGVSYAHPNRDVLFTDLNLTIHKQAKAALIGNNGAGKSTLLRIMAGELKPGSGSIYANGTTCYLPQLYGQFNHLTVAEALGVHAQLQALHRILQGDASEANFALLGDDWAVEERCREALEHWQLKGVDLQQQLGTLSGGQRTKVFLAGIRVQQPDHVLLDEPSNHLDAAGRALLYDYVKTTKHTLVVVSHDKQLLRLCDTIYELDKRGITTYGGNYDFYAEQKRQALAALNQELKDKEKALRKAKETERETMERRQRLDARGKKKQEKAGLPTISMNTFKNRAEKSTARLRDVHAEKIEDLAQARNALRDELVNVDAMKLTFSGPTLHPGKVLVEARNINMVFEGKRLWEQGLDLQLRSGTRLLIEGANGSGKTTLIRLLLGELRPDAGSLERVPIRAVYIDQDYSLIDPGLTVYEQVQRHNPGGMQEHEVKTCLTRFLFGSRHWDKPCHALSGGEKMRLMLCLLSIGSRAPDLMVLDEPTNNLDMQNAEILTEVMAAYRGTLVVVSHDAQFVERIGAKEQLRLG